MTRNTKIATSLITGAMLALLLAPSLAEARGSSLTAGRTAAIKTQIAGQLNQKNLMHVGKVRTADIRIRTSLVKQPANRRFIMGSSERKISWTVKSKIVAGTARSHTPVVPNGGKYTRLSDFRITKMPRAPLSR